MRTFLLAVLLLPACMAPTLTHIGTDGLSHGSDLGQVEGGGFVGGGVGVIENTHSLYDKGADTYTAGGAIGGGQLRVGLGGGNSLTFRGSGLSSGFGNFRLGGEHQIVDKGVALSAFWGLGTTISISTSAGLDTGLAFSVPVSDRTRWFAGAASNPLFVPGDGFGMYVVGGTGVSYRSAPGDRGRGVHFMAELTGSGAVLDPGGLDHGSSVGLVFTVQSARSKSSVSRQ